MESADDFKCLDSFLLNGDLSRNYACSQSANGRSILIAADTGLYVMLLQPNVASTNHALQCTKLFFKPSNYIIADKVDIDLNDIIYSLPKEQLYVSVLRTELSASLKNADPVEPTISNAQWSPKGRNKEAIAVLTSLHSLEIYSKRLDCNGTIQFVQVVNLTEHILKERKCFWKDTHNFNLLNLYTEYIKRVESIVPTAFCWSHNFKIEENYYSIIFVGHFTGCISVWRLQELQSDGSIVDCLYLGRYDSQLGQICCLYWHATCEYGGALCVGDQSGKLAVVQVKGLNYSQAFLGNETEFWSQNDVPIDKILVTNIDSFTILIAVKQSNLLFFALDIVGKVFDFVVHNVRNFYITGIECRKNILYIQTFDGPFKELTLEIEYQNLKICESVVPLKIELSKYRSHGFILSENKIFLGVLLYPKYAKQLYKVPGKIRFEILHNAALKPYEIIMSQGKTSLGNCWDCFEVLRLICLKEKRFPWLGLDPNLNYDTLSLQHLKVLRLVAKMSENVYNSILKVFSYNIKPYILIHYLVAIKLAVHRIRKLLKINQSGQTLSTFQFQSIFILNAFLKEVVVGGILAKANVGQTFVKEISQVMEICNDLEFPEMPLCWSCGERIMGPNCFPPHADCRCCISMMPIIMTSTIQCPICCSMAHPDILQEMNPIICPYCDVSMEQISINTKMDQILRENEQILKGDGEIQSVCFSDCLLERESFDSLEENDNEYIVFSDSEEDSNCENEQRGELKDLYTKMANMTVEEVNQFVKTVKY